MPAEALVTGQQGRCVLGVTLAQRQCLTVADRQPCALLLRWTVFTPKLATLLSAPY